MLEDGRTKCPEAEGILRLKNGEWTAPCTHWITYSQAAYSPGGIWIKQTMIPKCSQLHFPYLKGVLEQFYSLPRGSEHIPLETGHAFLS